MSTNCLVTKLKSVVENDSLIKLGGVKIHLVSGYGSSRAFAIPGFSKAELLNNTDNCYFTNASTTENYGTEITSSQAYQNQFIWVSDGECDLVIYSKYDIKVQNAPTIALGSYFESTSYLGESVASERETNNILSIRKEDSEAQEFDSLIDYKVNKFNAAFKIENAIRKMHLTFKYPSLVTSIETNRINVDFKNINDCINVRTLNILNVVQNCINLDKLSSLSNLEIFWYTLIRTIADFDLVNSIEELVQAYRAKGRTTCSSFTWKYIGNSNYTVTFNGNALTGATGAESNYHAVVSWTADTITVTYNGTTETISA